MPPRDVHVAHLPMKMRRIFSLVFSNVLLASAVSGQAADADPGPKIEEAQQKALAQLSQRGVLVQPLASGLNWYYVNFRGVEKADASTFALLQGASAVVDLDFSGQKFSDADLVPLAGLKNLKKLSLARTALKDSALVHLKGLAGLESLNLFQTEVTDAGLDQLAGLKGLKRLYVYQTKVTEAGVAKLKTALPGVRVELAAVLTVPPPPEPKTSRNRSNGSWKPAPEPGPAPWNAAYPKRSKAARFSGSMTMS